MPDFLNPKKDNFLGGNNIHHVIIIGLAATAVYLLAKKK
jgi:hypothetical protein